MVVDGSGLGSHEVVGSGISNVEPLGCATRTLVNALHSGSCPCLVVNLK
jgi:hypothetical protein